MKKSIYEYGKCDYCDSINSVLRPSPFMADRGAMMCEYCWNNTKEEYANCNDEHISDFSSSAGYEEVKEMVINDERLKEVLETLKDASDNDNTIEEIALIRIEKLERQNRELVQEIENIKVLLEVTGYAEQGIDKCKKLLKKYEGVE